MKLNFLFGRVKLIPALAIGALGVVLAGCVVASVYPFYTEKDLVFEPKLVGTWKTVPKENEEKETWRFEKLGDKSYKLLVGEGDKIEPYQACLFKLKDTLFLDMISLKDEREMIPSHFFLRLGAIDSTFSYSLLSAEWMAKLVKENPKAIRHHVVQDDPNDADKNHVVLTADTAELQKFILQHLKTEGAYTEAQVMKREAK
jgi:hypothetical protein